MSQENQITLRGYLTAEPKFYQKTPQAVPLTEIRVGCTPRRLNRSTGEWQEGPTSYYRVKCWRRLAINAVSSLHKGDQVIVRGHFLLSNWVDNQQRPRTSVEIEADTVGHDLAYGWAHYMRGQRPSENSAGVNSGELARQDMGTDSTGEDGDDVQAGTQAESWEPGFGGSPADASGVLRPEDGMPADGAAVTPGAETAPDPSETTSDIDSLARDIDALEREPVPF